MKSVGIMHANSHNQEEINFVLQNFTEIFTDYVQFTNYYLDSFTSNTLLHDDAYLTDSDVSFQTLKQYVTDYTTIIKINRSPDRHALEQLATVAGGSNVLVVNDDYDSAMETVVSLNDVGVGHITLIPYDQNLAHTGIYDELRIGITPHDISLIPPQIQEIIDIGYRKVSFDTMYTLMRFLDLDIDIINRNLFHYIRTVAESNTAFYDNYINSYLKSEMLNHVANHNKFAAILVDSQYRTVYANNKAFSLFHANDINKLDISSCISSDILKSSETRHTVELEGQNYHLDKFSFMLLDETAGYYITLQSEADMADITQENTQKGYVTKYSFKDIVRNSPAMEEVIRKARQVAPSDYTVLIRGESGCGKELIAQSIHNASYRNNGPFVAINCAALPENLLESELFGYDSGAFTGARSKGKIGLFEQANHGTIFLDEIGDIPPRLQSRLLRVIQEKQIMRLGSDRLIDVDIRLLTATNRNLEEAVASGEFRSDLFFRLNVLPLTIPPLRERREDILPLLAYFLGNAYRNVSKKELEILMKYDWPGNVRELENISTYYTSLSSLPDYLYQQQPSPKGGPGLTGFFDGQDAQANKAVLRPNRPKNDRELEAMLLAVIDEGTGFSHGIGRTAILKKMKNLSADISDDKLRKVLAGLAQKGLIRIEKGRGGTTITEFGRKKILEHEAFMSQNS